MEQSFRNKVIDDFCREKGIKREYSIARTRQNGIAERRNRTLIEAARIMLANSKLPTTFWAEAVSTACYVQNRVLVVKPHNKTPYELFRGFKPALSFMRPFGCHVTILNTLDSLGKFDGKSDEGFFVGYSLSKNKPMIEGNGPKWLFDIDSLTQSMNYVPVTAGTISNDSAVLDVTTGSFKLNVVGPSVNTASSYDLDSPKDMFTMGASHTLEATHVEFFSDEDELEVDLGNITNSYTVPTTPNTRIHKDHPIKNVIDDVKLTVHTRRMIKPTSEQGFLSIVEAMQEELLEDRRFACSLAALLKKGVSELTGSVRFGYCWPVPLVFAAGSIRQWHRRNRATVIYFKEEIIKHSSETIKYQVFLLGGNAISWASKKQTCITGSTIEYEFVALAVAGKEAEWLRNLIDEILILPKPIAPISIRCDSAPTMAKAYSPIYIGKTRHLGVKHNMIKELIMNGVISIKCKTKRITYVNMKFCRFKKLGLGFLGQGGCAPLRGQGAEPLAGVPLP
ncbi:putative ribonuclease H-like domain-containing protein, partial [Tanacetum coccineum]